MLASIFPPPYFLFPGAGFGTSSVHPHPPTTTFSPRAAPPSPPPFSHHPTPPPSPEDPQLPPPPPTPPTIVFLRPLNTPSRRTVLYFLPCSLLTVPQWSFISSQKGVCRFVGKGFFVFCSVMRHRGSPDRLSYGRFLFRLSFPYDLHRRTFAVLSLPFFALHLPKLPPPPA